MRDWIIVTSCIIVVVITGWLIFRSLDAPLAVVADATETMNISLEPVQVAAADSTVPVITHAGCHYTIIPQASYSISGLLVSKRRYVKGFMSWLSPYDYALIWGEVPNHLKYLEFDQIVRFCLFKYKPGLPLEMSYVESHLSNNHLIPATKNLRKALHKATKHDQVKLEGYLVNVLGRDKKGRNSSWNSSLSRTDRGNGACEIIYVQRLQINNTIYE